MKNNKTAQELALEWITKQSGNAKKLGVDCAVFDAIIEALTPPTDNRQAETIGKSTVTADADTLAEKNSLNAVSEALENAINTIKYLKCITNSNVIDAAIETGEIIDIEHVIYELRQALQSRAVASSSFQRVPVDNQDTTMPEVIWVDNKYEAFDCPNVLMEEPTKYIRADALGYIEGINHER